MKDILKRRLALSLLVLVAVTALLPGCVASQVVGSGNVISRTFNYADFTRVKISGGFQADIKASSSFGIEVAADDNLFDYINIKKNGDTLEVGMKPGSYRPSRKQATIMMPNLYGLELSDGSRVSVSGFNSSNNFSAALSDGSHLSGSLAAGNADFTLSDGSRVELAGSARDLKITSSDGSRLNLENFTVINADLKIGNGGTAGINVTGSVNANLSDGSDVTYVGNPTLGTIKLSGGATLSKKK